MMHMINNSTQISMEYIFDVFHYISGCTWQQFYVEYVTATVASAQSRTTYWAVVTGRFIGDRQNIGDIGGTAAAARAAPLFTAVGLVSAMATAIASAPASPDQQSLIATPMAVPPPIGSTPVPESQPQPPALFFLFCFLLGYRGIVHPPSADEGTERTWFEPEQRPRKRVPKRSVHGKQFPQGASKTSWRQDDLC